MALAQQTLRLTQRLKTLLEYPRKALEIFGARGRELGE